MPSNVEIKAVARQWDALRSTAQRIATQPCQVLHQEDVFFQVDRGRLKLRIFSDDHGELIYYERPDASAAKLSRYQIYSTSKPLELRSVLACCLGETVTVKKTREVFLVGQTRIHLDQVEQLGAFVELEVVLDTGQAIEQGERIVAELMKTLGIRKSDLVSGAYADLLRKKLRQCGD